MNTIYKNVLSDLKASIKADTYNARDRSKAGQVALVKARTEGTPPDEAANLRGTALGHREEANSGAWGRRHKMLAYAFLKVRTYVQVEQKVNQDKKPQVGEVAHFTPDDLGDGNTKKTTVEQIKMWLELGDKTRSFIIGNQVGIQTLLALQGILKDWEAKVARIERDLAWAKSKGDEWQTKVARLEIDLKYTANYRSKLASDLVTVQTSLQAAEAVQMGVAA